MTEFVVIGGGLCGAKGLYELANHAPNKSTITVIEAVPSQLFGGLAYAADRAPDMLRLNMPVRRSDFANFEWTDNKADTGDKRSDFNAWLVDHHPGLYTHAAFNRTAPRQMMQHYMTARCNGAMRNAKQRDIKIRVINDEARGVFESNGKSMLMLEGDNPLPFDRLLIATGTSEMAATSMFDNSRLKDHYAGDALARTTFARIEALPKNARILIMGTGMTMYDIVCFTMNRRPDIKMTAFSRSGNRHEGYERNNLTEPTPFDPSKFPLAAELPWQAQDEMFKVANGALRRHSRRSIGEHGTVVHHADTNGKTPAALERVMATMQTYLPTFIAMYGPETYGETLRKHSSLINTLRVNAGFEVVQDVNHAITAGKLKLIAAKALSARPNDDDGVEVILEQTAASGRPGQMRIEVADLVINTMGIAHDFRKPTSPLWKYMIGHEQTKPHRTGFGVQASRLGRLPGLPNVWVAGSPFNGNILTGQYGVDSGQPSAVPIIGPPANSIFTLAARTKETVRHGMLDMPVAGS